MQRSFRGLFLFLATLGLVLDLGSKYGMFRWLYHEGEPVVEGAFQYSEWPLPRGEYNLIPGWFKFTAEFDTHTETGEGFLQSLRTWSAPVMPRVNHGALFGLGNEHKGFSNRGFAFVSFVAAVAIIIWSFRKNSTTDLWLSVSLGLILAGTIGNLYDRLVFGGVRDFLYFYKIDWPVFNIADCCLVVGASLLMVQEVLVPVKQPESAPEGTASANSATSAASAIVGETALTASPTSEAQRA